jgi:hypothetical protein
MTREDLIQKMGPNTWNNYVVPAINSDMGNRIGREKLATAFYFEVVLPARSKRGLFCTSSSFDEILEQLPRERREQLQKVFEEKAKYFYCRHAATG